MGYDGISEAAEQSTAEPLKYTLTLTEVGLCGYFENFTRKVYMWGRKELYSTDRPFFWFKCHTFHIKQLV
jgi:hypothetical protein